MTFPILGGNGAVAGYSIDNSLRFNDGDSPTLSRTPASTGNRKTWTFSYWIKRSTLSIVQQTFAVGTNAATPWFLNYINSDDTLHVWFHNGTNSYFSYGLNKLRDVSAWYHIIYAVDTTQATASNRLKVYINGSEMTWNTYAPPAQNFDTQVNTTNTHYIGRAGNGQYFDGYIAETYFIDGQALSPTDFGEFDEDSGIWKPIEYTGTYGTNGFYLDFENSGSLGADQSGNGNNFTPTNLASTDQVIDTPTNNFATLNPISPSTVTFSQGNLRGVTNNPNTHAKSTIGMSDGKWYWEIVAESATTNPMIGIATEATPSTYWVGQSADSYAYYGNGLKYNNLSGSSYGATYTTGDIIGVALNLDANEITFYKNDVSQGVAFTSLPSVTYFAGISDGSGGASATLVANFGQDSSFAGNKTRQNNSDSNGYGDFYYAPPSGYLALCTQNLATELSPTIDDGSQYFNTVLYTGNGGTNAVTGVGFKPDWIWVKERSSTSGHRLADTTRGATKSLTSNDTGSETTNANIFSSLDSDGFTQGADNGVNESGQTYASWNWKANAGSTSSNTDGSITSTVQANTTAGFSIVTYTGTGSNATIGHGLGKSPSFLVTKARNTAGYAWVAWHSSFAGNESIELQSTDAKATSATSWNSTVPTSSVFSVGTRLGTNASGTTYVAYCFADIEGYSKFGSYTGNGSTDGTFVYTGFRPAFVLFKSSSISGENWVIQDSTRDSYNLVYHRLDAERSNAESTDIGAPHPNIDILSNGFKLRGSGDISNGSGGTYIYACFSANPFVSSTGIPVTAR